MMTEEAEDVLAVNPELEAMKAAFQEQIALMESVTAAQLQQFQDAQTKTLAELAAANALVAAQSEQLQELQAVSRDQTQSMTEIIAGQMAELNRMVEAERQRADELQATLLEQNDPEPEPTEEEKMDQLRPRLSEPTVLPDGRIDCMLNHPIHGIIPFTADPNDPEEHGRLIHRILAGA